jgi:hypothetical protein
MSTNPFSYIAWLPEGYPYTELPVWGARLIVGGWSSVQWVGDRITWHETDDEWMGRARPAIDKAYASLNSGDVDLSTQHPEDRCFQIAAEENGITVWYCCIHGYCHMVAIETEFTAVAA